MTFSPANELVIDPNKKTAIVYSVAESNFFIVEIKYKDTHYYLGEKGDPTQFTSLSLAKKAAKKESVEVAYHALENIYQEIGTTQTTSATTRFEYINLPLEGD